MFAKRQQGDGVILVLAIVAVIAIFAIAIYAAAKEREDWNRFAADHHCKVIGEMQGEWHSGGGFTSNGKYVTTFERTPDKEQFACDDGKTYWRNK